MDHFDVAERLLKTTRIPDSGTPGQTVCDDPPTEGEVARAQAHATLALVTELRYARRAAYR